MIITEANDFVRKIYDRMPALLTPYQFDPWLSGSARLEAAHALDAEVATDVAGVTSGEQLPRAGRRPDARR